MCTPYLENLNARFLEASNSIRSARLALVDGLLEGEEVKRRLAEATSEQKKCKHQEELDSWAERRAQQRKPEALTVDRFARNAIQIIREFHETRIEAARWNGATPQKLRDEFLATLQNLRPLCESVVLELRKLAESALRVGLPVTPDVMDQLARISAREYGSETPEVERATRLIDEYLSDPKIQAAVDLEISQLPANP